MTDDEILIILLVIAVFLVGPVMAVWAFISTRRLYRETRELRKELASLKRAGPIAQPDPEPKNPNQEPVIADEAASEDDPDEEQKEKTAGSNWNNEGLKDKAPHEDKDKSEADPIELGPDKPYEEGALEEETQIAALEASNSDLAKSEKASLNSASLNSAKISSESTIGGKLSIWIGGITLAIGGLLLVKYAIDNSILGPAARVTIGFIFGALIALAGEWTRRRPGTFSVPGFERANIPSILTGVGIFSMFGAIYAGHALYDLLGPGPTFIILAIIAVGSMFAALLHGPILATIGLFASYIVPLLISSDQGNPNVLAAYVLIVSCSAIYIAWFRAWLWFAMSVAGAMFLYALLLEAKFYQDHKLLLDSYLLASFIILAYTFAISLYQRKSNLEMPIDKAGSVALVAITLPMFFHLGWELPMAIEVMEMAALFALPMLIAYYYSAFRWIIFIPAALGAMRYTSMQITDMAQLVAQQQEYFRHGMDLGSSAAYAEYLAQQSRLKVAIGTYGATGIVTIAALLGLTTYFAKLTRARAELVATASAVSIAIYMAVYVRGDGENYVTHFALAALILFATFHFAAGWLVKTIDEGEAGREGAIASTLIGSLVALAIIVSILFEGVGFSIALGLIFAATAVTYLRYPIKGLRIFAVLTLLPYALVLLNDPFINKTIVATSSPIFNIMLLGYGIPLLGLMFGTYIFTKDKNDLWAQISQGATIILAVILVAMLALHIIDPTFEFRSYAQELAASATFVLIGGAFALGLTRIRLKGSKRLFRRFSDAIGILGMIFGLIALFAASYPIGQGRFAIFDDGYLINLISYAYGLPFALFALISWYGRKTKGKIYRYMALGFSGLSFIYWVNLTIRQAFNPGTFPSQSISQAEHYTYSLVWLLIGIAILFIGIKWRSLIWRKISAVVIVLVTLKVFIIDMSNLEGVLRAISFIGLGLVLMGIGFVYQRALRDIGSMPDEKGDLSEEPIPDAKP